MRDLFFKFLGVVLLCSVSCRESSSDTITINWKSGKAVSINIPSVVTGDLPVDSISSLVHIVVTGNPRREAIIGEFMPGNGLVFKPALAFSAGMQYDVLIRGTKKISFSIPANRNDLPEIVTVYPAADTLPVNLLKIYLQFSQPMQEARSVNFIRLVKNEKDTLKDVFLDLQPELWNEDRTVLTVWLDPGRIKRDLQPNLRLGAPLNVNEKYSIVVLKGWRSASGASLQNNWTHHFITTGRDSIGPVPEKWIIKDTAIDNKRSITIAFAQPLDHFLVMDCLSVTDDKGSVIKGKFIATANDASCLFIPEQSLAKGNFKLVIATRLEDLAGNNVNRPFDRDTKNSAEPSTASRREKNFVVR